MSTQTSHRDYEFWNSKDKDIWRTPDWLLNKIERGLDSTIHTDPAAAKTTKIGVWNNYTVADNGLEQPWEGNTFCNPPFSHKEKFLVKAVEEYQKDYNRMVIFVTPDSTDTKSWWHDYIAPHASYVWFSRGRVNYVDPDDGKTSGATFGTAISIFADDRIEGMYQGLLKELAQPDPNVDEDDGGHVVETVAAATAGD